MADQEADSREEPKYGWYEEDLESVGPDDDYKPWGA